MVDDYYSKDAVRVRHIPSGYDAVIKSYRGQHRNRDAGIKIIKARLNADSLGLKRPIIKEDVSESICPICEKGILKHAHEYLHYEFVDGHLVENPASAEFEVLSLYLVCQGEGACGSEQCDGYCTSYNKETMEILMEMNDQINKL